MKKISSDNTVKKLVEANVKTQEAVNSVVSTVKDLVSALKEAGEEPEELKTSTSSGDLRAVSDKLDQLLKQNLQLIKAVNDLTEMLRRHTGDFGARQSMSAQRVMPEPPPTPPPEWKRL